MHTVKSNLPERKGARPMNNMKKSIKRLFWLVTLMFALIILNIGKIILIDSKNYITSSYNPRINYNYGELKRGDIRDINNNILAVSNRDGESYSREYPFRYYASNTVGYTGIGKAGLEASENFELEKLHNEIFQRISYIFTGEELKGNSIITTLDIELQKKVNSALNDQKGAIVVMEPSTGRIMAMESYPNYNPNNVSMEWDELKEGEDSPLLNRATQGLYPPGSTFKLITALSALKNGIDLESYTYICTGEQAFENKVIHCFDNKAHGEVDIHSAMAYSCNCFFAEIGTQLGGDKLAQTVKDIHFIEKRNLGVESTKGEFALTGKSSESELVETAIGQGKTVITPLYMACFVSAIANDGNMMEPYLIDHIEYYNGKPAKTTIPKKIDTIMSMEEADQLTNMMIEVVEKGTGTTAAVSGVQVAGKTGTAENPTGSDHSWFIGFAPADDPQIAVAVVLENAKGNQKAAPIAGKIFSAFFSDQ